MADVPITPIATADVVAIDDEIARTTDAQGYGLGANGFVPKPFARLLAEKLALARAIFGTDIDLGSGSAIRKILEVAALEDARIWAALASIYDNQFVASATGEALSRLGEELGLPRPFLEATGTVQLTFTPPEDLTQILLPRGARMLTPGGHHVATAVAVTLHAAEPTRAVPVAAFYPGPEHNLDPAVADASGGRPMKIDRWNVDDSKLQWNGAVPGLTQLARDLARPPESIVAINHTQPLSGGERRWPDSRYRQLLLRAPRSIWSVEAIRTAASLVPGVRRVQVRDNLGGLDTNLPVFGSFNFGELLFASERDLGTPYFFDVIVAPTDDAFWEGANGVQAAVASAIEDLRPIGIGANVQRADQVFIAIKARVVAQGLPLPRGVGGALIDSPAANDLKQRLLRRVSDYVDQLAFGDPVRYAEVMWAMMNEPGVTDIVDLHLLRFPPLNPQAATAVLGQAGFQEMPIGAGISVAALQIATALNDDTQLVIV
jgi:hypothetical protein